MREPVDFRPESQALLLTREVEHAAGPGEHPAGLPIDLMVQAISRLRVLALLYAFVFFMVALLPALLSCRTGPACSPASFSGRRA